MYKPYNLDFFEANFREFLISEKVAPVTLKNYLSDLRHFMGWFLSEIQNQKLEFKIVTIDAKHIAKYQEYLRNNQTPIKTINRRLSTLRRFFSFCISQGWIIQNPAKHIANISSQHIQDKPCNNGLILKTEVIEQPRNSIKNILAEYKKYLIGNKVVEKEALLIVSDIDEFITIINFRKSAEPIINL